MLIRGTLQEISAQWVAIRLNGATQPIRIPISDDQAREIAGALGRGVVISIHAAEEAPPEDDGAPLIPFSAVKQHARLIAQTAASLDVKALARVVETLAQAVSVTVDGVHTEAEERRHDKANADMVVQAMADLLDATRGDVAALDSVVTAIAAIAPAAPSVTIFPDFVGAAPAPAATIEVSSIEDAISETTVELEPTPPVENSYEHALAYQQGAQAHIAATAAEPPPTRSPAPVPDEAPTVADGPKGKRSKK
jgi:hypothetical protein